MQRFDGQVALITGAASGIGRATAIRLGSEGASVYCIDLQAEALTDTVTMVEEAGGKAMACSCNVTDETAVQAAISECIASFGKLNHVINMAGILMFEETHKTAFEDFERVLKVNVLGTFLICKTALPHLLETKGSIVNAASTAAQAGLPWGCAYSASKGALLSMTRSIAVEYAKQGVRANTISPGDIITEGMASPKLPENVDMSLLARAMSLTGRKPPEVIASAIAMLCSEDGIHITGEDIRIDGGTLA